MKLIELHILQSYPVSCLNRDDVGAPKSAIFGGASRARISSQCLKRANREYARELCPDLFQGQRSRRVIAPLQSAFEKAGVPAEKAGSMATAVGEYLSGMDAKPTEKGELKVKTLVFLSPAEIAAIAHDLAAAATAGVKPKEQEKLIAKAVKSAHFKDAADIAIFGRMVASDHSLTVEGAGMFSHALSTHRVDNDIDFFAAVDDLQKSDEAGAGMTGTLEFNAACYYRYAAINLDLLTEHLPDFSEAQRRSVLDAFIRATLQAVPGARKNSMNAHTFPAFALGLRRTFGHPLQLVNAFENPVKARGQGLVAESIAALEQELKIMKETWGVTYAGEFRLPGMNLETFCSSLLAGL